MDELAGSPTESQNPDVEVPDVPFAALARFRFAADAGYFADELQGQFRIPATVRLEESFDTVTAQAVVAFVLSVPVKQTDEAIPRLRELIEAAQTGEYDGVPGGLDGPVAPVPATATLVDADSEASVTVTAGPRFPSWMFLVLVCAGAVILIQSRQNELVPEAAVDAEAPLTKEQLFLRELLATSPEPWVRETRDGGRQEISLDESTGTVRIRGDSDGDGRFEVDRRIRLSSEP